MQLTMKRHSNFIDRLGERHLTKESYWITIIEYSNNRESAVKFEDGTILYNRQYIDICKGNIKHPFHLSVVGVGFIGIGEYNSVEHSKYYFVWNSMLKRCYDEKTKEKQPTYKDVTVCEEWHNFQNFAEWCTENYKENYVLDKDIICKNCKLYSPDTCLFIPSAINSIFILNKNTIYPTGVFKRGNKFGAQINIENTVKNLGYFSTVSDASNAFKITKKQHIANKANEWKEKISEKAYNSIMKHAE